MTIRDETFYVKAFETYNPSGGGEEEWNMECQAVVHRAACFAAGARSLIVYGSAREARLASGWLNPNIAEAKPGDIGYWEWSDQDHTAFYLGGGWWFMGSRHVDNFVGGVARNLGTIQHERFQEKTGLTFLGTSATNGGNVVPIEHAAPVVLPTRAQRQVADEAVNRRYFPRADAPLTGLVAAGAIIAPIGYTTLGELANGTRVWYHDGMGWMNAASFTEIHGHDLADITEYPPSPAPEPPVVVEPPIVAPPVVITPPVVVVPPVVVDPPEPANPEPGTPPKPEPEEETPVTDEKTPADQIKEVANAIDVLADDANVQALTKPLLAKIPKKVRAGIYEAGKWLGLAGAAALGVAGVLSGDAELYAGAGGSLLLAVSNFVAKANLA